MASSSVPADCIHLLAAGKEGNEYTLCLDLAHCILLPHARKINIATSAPIVLAIEEYNQRTSNIAGAGLPLVDFERGYFWKPEGRPQRMGANPCHDCHFI